jgi:catechol 2,3-dioxygenase-like lactoylglutathione lyase family enzyme
MFFISKFSMCVAFTIIGSSVAHAESRQPFESPPTVISLASFGRSVASLERSVAFYRDVLGMELSEKSLPHPESDRRLQQLWNTPGAKFRSVHFKVPYTPINLALTEFSGIAQMPVQGNPGQPGIPWLTLSLKDDAAFAGIERARPPGFSLFPDRPPPSVSDQSVASPPLNPGPPRPKPNEIGAVLKLAFIRDPDGFLVEVMHRDPKSWFTVADPILLSEQSADPIQGPPVVGLQFVLWGPTVDAVRFYYDLLEFDIRPGYTRSLQELFSISDKVPPDADCTSDRRGPSIMDMTNQKPVSGCWSPQPGPPGLAPKGKGTRAVSGNCAGVRCEWFENDPPGLPFQPHIQDPGAGYLSVWVRDLDAVLSRMKAAGVRVVSQGGKAVRFAGDKRIVVRDYSGYYVELIQKDISR